MKRLPFAAAQESVVGVALFGSSGTHDEVCLTTSLSACDAFGHRLRVGNSLRGVVHFTVLGDRPSQA